MAVLAQLIANSLIAGSMYALAALGYSMVYSILKFANFANGPVAMVGAYTTFLLYTRLGLALPVAFAISIVLTALLGVLVDKVAYKPLRRAPKISVLITAISVSFIIEALVLMFVGANIQMFPFPAVEGLMIGPIYITPVQLISFASSLVAMACLWLLLAKTSLGKAIRATSDNPELAAVNGVATESIYSAVFGIGAALAAVAGTLIGMQTTLVPTMGFNITIVGFAAVVLGGMGRIEGGVLGAFILAFTQNLGVWYLLGGDTRWTTTFGYLVLVLFLIVKPTGLLGRKGEGRVF